MTEAWAIIIAATITAVGGVIGVAINEFKKMKTQNSRDHGAVMAKLEDVRKGVTHVSERLDDHIDWHLKK